MVKNLWKQIEVVCGNHEKDYPVMGLKQGHRSLFYSCPSIIRMQDSPVKQPAGIMLAQKILRKSWRFCLQKQKHKCCPVRRSV